MAIATTDQKARLLDLMTGVLEMVRDGNRNIDQVSAMLQVIKDDPEFAMRLLAKNGNWPIWRILTIGGVDVKRLQKQLKDGGFYASDWARDIMGKSAFTTLPKPMEIQLVRIKVADLGFKEMPTTTELFVRAKERGLDLCSAEVGPHLRLADADQQRSTLYWVAMEPITVSDGDPCVFNVERNDDGKQWLNANYANPNDRWNLDDTIVFRL